MITLDLTRISGLRPVCKGILSLVGHENQTVKYFNELRSNGNDDLAICQALIAAVEQGLLQPYVFSIFLPWCKELDRVLMVCMACEFNAAIRSAAIKSLGRRLKKPTKQDNILSLSHILGNTQALLSLFAQSSVADVKHLCVAIGNSGRHGCRQQHAFKERQEAVERLLRALLPAVYPDEALTCRDKRPLQHLYAIMLPACSANFVKTVLDAHDQSNPLFRWRHLPHLLRSHRSLFRKRAEDYLFGLTSKADPDVHRYVDVFLSQDKAFALSALQRRHDGTITDQCWSTHSDVSIAFHLVKCLSKSRHASKKSVAVQISDIILMGLEMLDRKVHNARHKEGDKKWLHLAMDLFTFALTGWTKWPEIFERALILGLQLDLGSLPVTAFHDYLSTVTRPGFPEAQRPRLLQLYCLHIGKEGADIFAEGANFTPLAGRPWPHEVFTYLDIKQSTRILKKLEDVNPDFNFLQPPSTKVSILQVREAPGQKNFNVHLLLVLLHRNDSKVRQRAREAVDGLRKKAAAAREQAERSAFAEVASAYAIATGDLDLYRETVLWQQRFVRDPLTAQRLFDRGAVLTEEGITLLSALQSPQDSHSALSPVTVRTADETLKTFYETYRLAKREPSFQPSHWLSVKSLFGAVYKKRVQHLEMLCDSEGNAVVWNGFLDAIQWMDIDFLNRIYIPAMDLLKLFNPSLLAVATQDLLRVGAERRQEQNRTPEDDLLERMSYEALMMLAKSNTPNLASNLVVQTIMDRPDASSWHRQLLSARFLKRLRAKEAHGVLVSLAKAISDKLEEQSYVRVGETEPAKHAPPKSLVKVTTVKHLAQLLNHVDFIPNETAVEVLVELLKNAQHRDIRLAALESLLGLLDRLCTEAKAEWAANPTIETIMGALETMIPVVGSINESRPPRDEDWEMAEITDVLPEMDDSQMPSLMEALLRAAAGTRYRGLHFIQIALVERIILPILRQSQVEHGRWISLFLTKYQAPFTERDVPLTPVVPSIWHRVLTFSYPLVGPAILADFHAYALHQIVPDARLEKFNAALRADPQLRKRAEVQHWMDVYDCRVTSLAQSGILTLLDILKQKDDKALGIDYAPLIDFVLQHANLFLDHYEEYANIWEQFTTRLALDRLTLRNAEKYRLWQDNYGNIVRSLSDEIDKRKTQKMYGLLPSRTKLELWLLPFLDLGGSGSASGFVLQLEDVLLRLLQASESQALSWFDMAREVQTIAALIDGKEIKSKVASELGKLADYNNNNNNNNINHNKEDIAARDGGSAVLVQTRQALDLIKVEVAMHLFDDCEDVEVVKGPGRERLKEWRACGSESIRERVFRWDGRRRIERD